MTSKSNKLGQADLVFGLWSEFISSSVHASLRAALMIYATLVNTQTHTDNFW